METILRAMDVKKYYHPKRDIGDILRGRRRIVRALDGVSLDMYRGEILSLVGESGSGKTTLGRIIVGLEEPTSGVIEFHGKRLQQYLKKGGLNRLKVQMIYQDPYSSLDPRVKIGQQLMTPLILHGLAKHDEARSLVQKC